MEGGDGRVQETPKGPGSPSSQQEDQRHYDTLLRVNTQTAAADADNECEEQEGDDAGNDEGDGNVEPGGVKDHGRGGERDLGDGKVDETEGGQGEGTGPEQGTNDDGLPVVTGAPEEEPGGGKDGDEEDGNPAGPLSQDGSVDCGSEWRGDANKNDVNVDVAQGDETIADDQGG